MILLAIGLLAWIGAHFFRRVAPEARAALGPKGHAIMSALILVSVILMVIGYRAADFVAVYHPLPVPGPVIGILMLATLLMFGAGKAKSIAVSYVRHPMLTGVIMLCAVHLLVNGDRASILLFGGLAAWSVTQMILINRAEGPWQKPAAGSLKGDMKNLIIALVVFAIAVSIHIWTGHSPFAASYR